MRRQRRPLSRALFLCRQIARYDCFFVFRKIGIARRYYGWMYLLARRAPEASQKEGQRLCACLVAMGPNFIKLGQVLSVRPDLVGEALAASLSQLQDRLPPEPNARALLARAGRVPLDWLAHFDETPVAAASVAQVHRARLKTGEWVAIKLLRPSVREIFEQDRALLVWFTALQERFLPILAPLRLGELVATWWHWSEQELDLLTEAAALSELQDNFKNEQAIYFPRLHWAYCTRDAMVMEWIEGARITESQKLAQWGIDPKHILAKAIELFFTQVFRDGFFHADIHPGNLLIDQQGRLVPLDFGIMGRLDTATRRFIAQILAGIGRRDYPAVARAYARAGYLPAGQPVEKFAQAFRGVCEPLFARGEDHSFARLMARILTITNRFDLEVQAHLLLAQKTMFQAEGLGRLVDTELNVWQSLTPLAVAYLAERRAPGALLREKKRELQDRLADLARHASQLDRYLEEKWRVSQGPSAWELARGGGARARLSPAPAPGRGRPSAFLLFKRLSWFFPGFFLGVAAGGIGVVLWLAQHG